ncbi:MAG: hypothetical protein JSS86_07000 [Cyanobacteria bacterium SZAS LIN-2]|nr:hypothetical protein [Cyanobacteria bacterium SZAS LIN-2]
MGNEINIKEQHERGEALSLLKGAHNGENFTDFLNEGRSLSQRDRLGLYMKDIQKTTGDFPDVEIHFDKDGHLEQIEMKRSAFNPLSYIVGDKEVYHAKHDPRESVTDPDKFVIYGSPYKVPPADQVSAPMG